MDQLSSFSNVTLSESAWTHPMCPTFKPNQLFQNPVNELLVVDFDETLTVSDTISHLADLALNTFENVHRRNPIRRKKWISDILEYENDLEKFQTWWDEELPARNATNAKRCAGSQESCLTIKDLGEYLAKSDEVELASIERVSKHKILEGLSRKVLLESGAEDIPRQEKALESIRTWLANSSYAEHPWKYGGEHVVDITDKGAQLQEAVNFQPKFHRDWAILSNNWSRDMILGALFPMADTSLDKLIASNMGTEAPWAYYCYLVSRIHSGDLEFTPGEPRTVPENLPAKERISKYWSQLETSESTGKFTSTIRTGLDKLREFRTIRSNYQRKLAMQVVYPSLGSVEKPRLFTIYVGDKLNDLLCMLEASVGILVGQDKKVLAWAKVLQIPVETKLPPYQDLVARHHRGTMEGECKRHRKRDIVTTAAGTIALPNTNGPIYQIDNWEQFNEWANRDASK
ncbi:hypothetical protein IWQ62_000130 [Dispira parvispora]|uniref:Uncharacterized protein n=1 Tax=Dispira parvispora TaxID=1520584 RepID=A0A9W8B1C2_9FUNG|nr:hypothetical protein IWQ62_000130 [Dispira parvispora]